MQRPSVSLVPFLVLLVPIPVFAQQTRGPTAGPVAIAREDDAVRATFTLSWSNAWRNARNHDGAWVVLRGPDSRVPPLRLAATGHEASGGPAPAAIEGSADRLGVFVAPAAEHRGDVSWELSLALDASAGGLPETVTAWTVGMVLVPGGGFEAGDDDPLAVRFGAFHRLGEDGTPAGPFRIDDEAEIRVAREPGALWYETDRDRYRGDQQGPIPAAWPKGTRPFWVMKHELTQGLYAAFLNGQPPEWQQRRAPLELDGGETQTCSIERVDGRFVASAPERPCNFVTWDDTCALFDWLGLRPMTELEFEKAARGPRRPTAGDYPWGAASFERLERVVQSTRDLTLATAEDERGLSDATVARFGASHYWVMDLAGSLWERVVSAGHPAGRAFRGTHGDGVLSAEGNATNDDWPSSGPDGREAGGVGYRGGAEYFSDRRADDPTNPQSPVAVRTYAGWGGAYRYQTYSARACRSLDTAPATRQPTRAESNALRDELLERRERDQQMRKRDYSSMSDEERRRAFDEALRVDRENTARMMEIVDTFGWPTSAMIGQEASDAAFLLVQHADHEPEFQARCLPMLEAAAARGEASKNALAYLTDRVRVKQRRPQRYGTQYYVSEHADGSVALDDDGRPTYLLPIVEDVETLDARRADMVLEPWRDYEVRMARSQDREPADRPRAWDGSLPVDPQRG